MGIEPGTSRFIASYLFHGAIMAHMQGSLSTLLDPLHVLNTALESIHFTSMQTQSVCSNISPKNRGN